MPRSVASESAASSSASLRLTATAAPTRLSTQRVLDLVQVLGPVLGAAHTDVPARADDQLDQLRACLRQRTIGRFGSLEGFAGRRAGGKSEPLRPSRVIDHIHIFDDLRWVG